MNAVGDSKNRESTANTKVWTRAKGNNGEFKLESAFQFKVFSISNFTIRMDPSATIVRLTLHILHSVCMVWNYLHQDLQCLWRLSWFCLVFRWRSPEERFLEIASWRSIYGKCEGCCWLLLHHTTDRGVGPLWIVRFSVCEVSIPVLGPDLQW